MYTYVTSLEFHEADLIIEASYPLALYLGLSNLVSGEVDIGASGY